MTAVGLVGAARRRGLLALVVLPAIAAQAQAPRDERLAAAIARAQAQADGTGGPLLHAFVDPRCGACQLLRQRLQPLIRGGQLRVRWIAVRVIDGTAPATDTVLANTALLALVSGSVQTPTLAYRDEAGALCVRVGAWVDLAQLLAAQC